MSISNITGGLKLIYIYFKPENYNLGIVLLKFIKNYISYK